MPCVLHALSKTNPQFYVGCGRHSAELRLYPQLSWPDPQPGGGHGGVAPEGSYEPRGLCPNNPMWGPLVQVCQELHVADDKVLVIY